MGTMGAGRRQGNPRFSEVVLERAGGSGAVVMVGAPGCR